jgi:hypothetical protein
VADFFARTEQLKKRVGSGSLAGIFAVDGGERTVPLETGFWLNYMGRYGRKEIRNWTTEGTGPHAAQNSLEATYRSSLEDIAKTTLQAGPQGAMKRHVERVDEKFQTIAPLDEGTYRQSTGRFVTDNGQLIHEKYGASYGQEPRT